MNEENEKQKTMTTISKKYVKIYLYEIKNNSFLMHVIYCSVYPKKDGEKKLIRIKRIIHFIIKYKKYYK